MFENFPYSNFHDLNTDWLIDRVKNVETSEANAKESEENAKASEIASAQSASASAQSAQESAQSASASAQSATASANSATEANDYVTSTRAQVNLLQSRVDNIIPSGTQTEGNTELLDIRVGYNGVTYPSAGDAVRGQVTNLENKIGYKLISLSNILTVTGRYVRSSDGNTSASANYNCSDYLPVKTGDVIKAGLRGTGTIGLIAFYTSTAYTDFVECIAGEGATAIKEITYTVPNDGYVRISTNITYASGDEYVYFSNDMPDSTKILYKKNADNILSLQNSLSDSEIETSYVNGYLTANGTIANQSSTNVEITSDKIYSLTKLNISLEFAESQTIWVAICAFDSTDTLLGTREVYSITGTNIDIQYTAPTGAYYLRFSFRTYGADYTITLSGMYGIKAISERQEVNEETIETGIQLTKDVSAFASNVGKFKPCYDHLFVSTPATRITIPHESLFHVRVSKKLGFDVIEANVWSTSDNVYIVNHLGANGIFGPYFTHVDGVTDISNININSVTWEWVSENVRYNTTVEKYRVRPVRLEEFLAECRKQNIIPFITLQTQELVDIVEGIMGKDNYIAYKSSRSIAPTCMHFAWVAETTKEGILNYCRNIGKPFIYGMSNPTAFTDTELRDIVDSLHKEGYFIGTSYQDNEWHKYSDMGFDFNGTQKRVNRLPSGNLYNFESIFNFDDFNYTSATESNGVLTYSENGTLSPKAETAIYPVSMFDIELWFNGTITLNAIGEQTQNVEYISDGSESVFVCIPVINGLPVPVFTVNSGTVIYDVKYKASIA